MDFDKLIAELRNDPLSIGYAGMSDREAVDALKAASRVEVYSRFCSFREIAAVLTDDEYRQLKNDLDKLSAASPRVADMVSFLRLPSSDTGSTGGLDFGSAEVRALVDALPTLSVTGKTKIKALAERRISRAAEIGIDSPTLHEISVARNMERLKHGAS